MKVKHLIAPSTTEALKSIVNIPIPVKASYRVSKIVKKVEKELETYNEVRMSAIKRLADKDEKGDLIVKDGQVQFSDENKEVFFKELTELGETDVEMESIPLECFGEKVEIPSTVFAALGDLIQA